jgi:hypothetical protein
MPYQTPVDHLPLAGKCVGRVEAYVITALRYIAQKNAADAFITHRYNLHRHRRTKLLLANDGSLLQQLRRLLFLLMLDVIWIQASSMLVYGGICCTRHVCMLYSAMMAMLCGTRHRYPQCCETVMQAELESRRSRLMYECLILQ